MRLVLLLLLTLFGRPLAESGVNSVAIVKAPLRRRAARIHTSACSMNRDYVIKRHPAGAGVSPSAWPRSPPSPGRSPASFSCLPCKADDAALGRDRHGLSVVHEPQRWRIVVQLP